MAGGGGGGGGTIFFIVFSAVSRGGLWPKSGQAIARMPDRRLRPCILDAAGGSSKKEQGLQYALAPSHDSLVFVFETQVSSYFLTMYI